MELKKKLANCLITFLIKGNLSFSIWLRCLSRNPPDCIILDNWVFDNLISADKMFADLRRFVTCLVVNNNSCGKLVYH